MVKDRKIAELHVTGELLVELFREGTKHYKVLHGLPDDAEIVEADYNKDTYVVNLLIHSDQFPVVPEGGKPPKLDLQTGSPGSRFVLLPGKE